MHQVAETAPGGMRRRGPPRFLPDLGAGPRKAGKTGEMGEEGSQGKLEPHSLGTTARALFYQEKCACVCAGGVIWV